MTDPSSPVHRPSTIIPPARPDRHLPWPDCYNARDLGGLPTADGRETRRRSIIRSDILSRLSEAGQQALFEYGVRTIIDLRTPAEVVEHPPFTGRDQSLTYLHLPMEERLPHVSALIKKVQSRGEAYCIILDHYPKNTAAVMRAIIAARPGGIVVHCHSGKDRTGTIAAMLLRLVGVPAAEVVADYAESQERLRPIYEQIVRDAGGEDKVGFWGRPTATADMMFMFLDHLEANYGGAEGYLRTAGLSKAEIEVLKQRLRPLGRARASAMLSP